MTPPLAQLQDLYDQNRFLEAFRLTTDYWKPPLQVDGFSSDELILAGRLAARLGAGRLCRWLFRSALELDPTNAKARYFTLGQRRRGWSLFDQLRSWQASPDLEGADANTQASWLSFQAVTWASLRDFERATACVERAKSLGTRDSWVFSCESSVLTMRDRRDEALRAAEIAWELNPGAPYTAHALGECLVNQRRLQEASDRLSRAAEGPCESFEVAQSACWYACALAETLERGERNRVLERARELCEQAARLAPLADRHTRASFARTYLDIAELQDDHAEMERWAKEVGSPFHRKVLENLRSNPSGARIRLPFRRALQKYDECLPMSLTSALAAMGSAVDPEAMASELTFGGTAEWRAAEWLQQRSFEVRFFTAQPDVAKRLIQNGIAFVMTLEGDANSHAVAAVGLDEAAGTLLVYDPSASRTAEYLLESIGKDEAPLGPRSMAVVPRDKSALLDSLLPKADAEAAAARIASHRAHVLSGSAAAHKIVDAMLQSHPQHPITKLLNAMRDVEVGRVSAALPQFQELLTLFPGSAPARAQLLACCRSFGDTALMRATLASVVEKGTLPGIQSRQPWSYPPSTYISEYADLLRESADSRAKSRRLLDGVLAREASCGHAWHVLADLLWDEHDLEGAVLAYRIAAGLQTNNEHYARAYCDALALIGRPEEGLQWIEARARTFGSSSPAIATWITWIAALEHWGQPQKALDACDEALAVHETSPDLVGFAASFLARMGQWERAEALLHRLRDMGNSALFHQAAADFYHRQGEIEKALKYAQAWIDESPLSVPARREFASITNAKSGVTAALNCAAQWSAEHPGHDELEELYEQYLEQAAAPRRKKYALLLRRLKRNPEDGWAWREVAFSCIAEYDQKDEAGRKKLKRRLHHLIGECDRTAPQDVATMRLRAQWCEVRGEWPEAVEQWMNSIRREPGNPFGYRQIWDCLSRCDSEKRREIWQKLSDLLLSYPGRLAAARENILMVARRFGIAEAEETAAAWSRKRPDDPEVTEAYADVLLEQGHGRTDARRALDLLQPATERFPHHLGLRFSLASAQRKLGRLTEAEQTLAEIIRRHPDNSHAQMELARVDERHGRIDQALSTLAVAATRDPQNVDIPELRVRILLGANRHKEARAALDEATLRFSESVPWRERAIRLYVDCGDSERAVRVAREGIVVYPRGAYLWFLLGRALNELPRFASQGEVESCLRRSLALNRGLFQTADWLAMLLVDQRQYTEAEGVMAAIRERLSDPSPALGRLAWIHRAQGDKQAARAELASVLRETPWYGWGWNLLMEWLTEDQAWGEAKSVLAAIPVEFRTNTQFRRQRVMLLEKAGLPAADLDSEWSSLLQDFPEEVPLHLHRYDSLRNAKRNAEAANVIESIRPIDPDSPYTLARWAEVLSENSKTADQAIDVLLQIWFAEVEESNWPPDYAWKAVKRAKKGEAAYGKAVERLTKGLRPTPTALSLMASYAVEKSAPQKPPLQPYWRTWFPDDAAREVLRLQELVDAATWPKEGYRSRLLKQLSDLGYKRLVAKYWRGHRAEVEHDVEAWAETGRALVVLKRNREASKLLADWRSRIGVPMWTVANYVNTLGSRELKEIRSACHDALLGLPHDHCAKYLVHRELEACALLGDEAGVRETWKEHRNYFNGRLEQGEWFDPKRKPLLGDLLVLGRAAQENDNKMYRKTLRSLRWKRFWSGGTSQLSNKSGTNILRWWWLIWVLYLLIRLLVQP